MSQGKLINEIGNKYGYLTVTERAPNNKENRVMWKCKCDCGNELIVLEKSLRNGNTKSCGCYKKEQIINSNISRSNNLIDKRFGKLLVISEEGFITHTSNKKSRIYKCLCDCGNYCLVQHQYLEYGDTISCGCIRSKGGFQIEQLLKQYNIDYKKEYKFKDLKDKDLLRFDFAIFNNLQLVGLIEFQGEQHIDKLNGYYSKDIVKHDKIKKEYCDKNNIPLIIINYKRNYNLTLKDLQLDKIGGFNIGI